MSSNLIAYVIGAITMIISALLVFGLPALAVIVVKYFKLRERELILRLEADQRTGSSTEDRLRSLEDAVAALERAVRAQPALPSTEVVEEAGETQRTAAWTRAR